MADAQTILMLLFLLNALTIVPFWAVISRMLDRMKKYHHMKWLAVGVGVLDPKMTQASAGLTWNNFRVFKYVLGGDPELDSDAELLRMRKIAKALFIPGAILLVSSILFAWLCIFFRYPLSM